MTIATLSVLAIVAAGTVVCAYELRQMRIRSSLAAERLEESAARQAQDYEAVSSRVWSAVSKKAN